MQHSAEAEPSEGTALTCGCEERLVVLLCQREKRRSEDRHAFECACGRQPTLDVRAVEEASGADEESGIGAPVRTLNGPTMATGRSPPS